MHRTDNQVSGFGGGDRIFDSFQVAHFTDHDHVRVFTQGGFEGVAVVDRMVVDLTLGHLTVAGDLQDLDRVFH